jgi:predicted FMN-binding regulatory protein PaiB
VVTEILSKIEYGTLALCIDNKPYCVPLPLDNKIYEKAINATALFKLVSNEISCKFKLGQNFNEDRLKRVSEHLIQRGSKKDLETLELI